jgi:hypothetical protein
VGGQEEEIEKKRGRMKVRERERERGGGGIKRLVSFEAGAEAGVERGGGMSQVRHDFLLGQAWVPCIVPAAKSPAGEVFAGH